VNIFFASIEKPTFLAIVNKAKFIKELYKHKISTKEYSNGEKDIIIKTKDEQR